MRLRVGAVKTNGQRRWRAMKEPSGPQSTISAGARESWQPDARPPQAPRPRFPRLPFRSKRARLGLAAAVLLLAGAALGIYLYERDRTGSIYHPNARFVPENTPALPAKPQDRFSWPFYGYTKEHTRFFPAPPQVRPPFKLLWTRNFGTLLEFPPVIRGDPS